MQKYKNYSRLLAINPRSGRPDNGAERPFSSVDFDLRLVLYLKNCRQAAQDLILLHFSAAANTGSNLLLACRLSKTPAAGQKPKEH